VENESKEKGMNLKKTTAVLALVLVSALVCAQSAADFNVELTEDGEGVVITGYTGKVTAVRIPSTIEGFPVKAIGEGVFKVLGPDDLIAVGILYGKEVLAKYDPLMLTSISLPAGLEYIGKNAFAYQSKLTSVTIPDSVTEIGEGAFMGCSALASVTLPKGLTALNYRVFASTGLTALPNLGSITDIGAAAFLSCKKLTTVVIPEGVTEIEVGAFADCSALISVSLPSTIQAMGDGVFHDCSALTTVTIPDSVKLIKAGGSEYQYISPKEIFSGCPKLNLATQARFRKMDEQAAEANEKAVQGYGK
jgi:hypothetical protein